jgi:hypothetical protein
MKQRHIFFTQRSAAQRSAAHPLPTAICRALILATFGVVSVHFNQKGQRHTVSPSTQQQRLHTLLVAPQTRSSCSLDQAQPRSVFFRFFPTCRVPPWLSRSTVVTRRRLRRRRTSPSSLLPCFDRFGSDNIRMEWNTICLRPALLTLR